MRHLNVDSLIGYAEGQLSPLKEQLVNRHIGTCATCSAEAFRWFSIFDLMKASDLQSAPRHAVRNSFSIYQLRKPASKLPDVFALLVFDSAMASAAAGIRGASDAQQVLLRCDHFDVRLRR